MYTSINEAELNAFGLSSADFEQDAVEIWPDCLEVYAIFDDMNTQWRIGMNGATGLDYSALPIVLDANNVKISKELLSDLRIMEVAALKEMNKKDK